MSKKRQKHQGFTLVEIAIVLVIIGLIIGGIIKGQSLIEQARVKRVISDVDNLRAAVYAFQDKYGMKPGDEDLGSGGSQIPNNDTGNGDGDGLMERAERFDIWEDLALGGFITGDYDGSSDLPSHAFGGDIILYRRTINGINQEWFELENLTNEAAFEIDSKIDGDLDHQAGSVQATGPYTTTASNLDVYIEF